MPAIHDDDSETPPSDNLTTRLPFPPVTPSHILNCSYHSWYARYKSISPKARLIALSQPFLSYLRADGIVLPDDDEAEDTTWSDDHDSGHFSDSDEEDEQEDVSAPWRDVHLAIKSTIAELGGRVAPKLNWSAPKDATWISASNSMECRTPNDVLLLLKSSDFITHDLEHAFDDTSSPTSMPRNDDIPFHLVLRKYVEVNPSVEFRCFVRARKLIALCQRDLNHFDFLEKLQDRLQSKIQEFFDVRLRDTFPDPDFVFDVYVPAPHDRVWLIDINPWAPRTDSLLFSWLELLTMDEPPDNQDDDSTKEVSVRLPLRLSNEASTSLDRQLEEHTFEDDTDATDDEDVDGEIWQPEFRLVRKGDPEAYAFNTPKYSAHKMPKDVVDASQSGEGLREFAKEWKDFLEKRIQEDLSAGDDSE